MMSDLDWNRMMSLVTNSIISLTAIMWMGVIGRHVASKWGLLRPESKLLVIGMGVWVLGEILRVGYWVPAMWLNTPNGFIYHEWWYANRWISYSLATPLMVGGMWLVLAAYFPSKSRAFFSILLIAAVLSLIIAVTWQASELGYWFDRTEVSSWLESLLLN